MRSGSPRGIGNLKIQIQHISSRLIILWLEYLPAPTLFGLHPCRIKKKKAIANRQKCRKSEKFHPIRPQRKSSAENIMF